MPIALIVQNRGWNSYFITLLASYASSNLCRLRHNYVLLCSCCARVSVGQRICQCLMICVHGPGFRRDTFIAKAYHTTSPWRPTITFADALPC